MKIKSKIENLVNTFITDPENAEKAYYKKPAHWSSSDIHVFWRLVSQSEKVKPIYETAGEFLDYLIDNNLAYPGEVATDYKDYYRTEKFRTDVGLVTFCENYLAENFYAEDIDTEIDPDLYEKVEQAEELWYWHYILHLAAQDTIWDGDFFESVTDYL